MANSTFTNTAGAVAIILGVGGSFYGASENLSEKFSVLHTSILQNGHRIDKMESGNARFAEIEARLTEAERLVAIDKERWARHWGLWRDEIEAAERANSVPASLSMFAPGVVPPPPQSPVPVPDPVPEP